MTEELDPAEDFPWCVRMAYEPVFDVPEAPWRVDANWDDAYFGSAKQVIEGVVAGRLRPAIEGVAGLFLFRHYLEIALKYVIFHARWLRDTSTNAQLEEIEDVKNTHNLAWLWQTAVRECEGKIPKDSWEAHDVEFARRMVMEFHAVDQKGIRFRYHGEKFGVDRRPQNERISVVQHLHVNYPLLLSEMQHTRDVLWAIDTYLVETHGQNAEWEAEMSSW